MADLEPWSPGDTSEFERRLLDAAKRDRVPDTLKLRMVKALSAAPPAGAGLTVGKAVGGLLSAKAGLWGALALAVVAGVTGWRAAKPMRETNAVQVALPRVSEPVSVPMPVAAAPAPPAEQVTTPPSIANEPSPDANTKPVAAAAKPGNGAELREEVALLDRTRDALRSGANQRALRLLDQHDKRFAHATLVPEAEALRIEALVQSGAKDRAERLSRRFIEAYPRHPLADRVTQLTAHSGPPVDSQ